MKRAVLFLLLAAVLCSVAASATTVVYVPLQKSIRLSEHVLIGHVMELTPAYDREGQVVTRVTLLVEESLKGSAEPGELFTFEAWGGSLDGVNVETVGEAKYRLGEKVMVELERVGDEYHTLGLSFGKWSVVRDDKDQPWAVRSLYDLNMVGVNEVPVTRVRLDDVRNLSRGPLSF